MCRLFPVDDSVDLDEMVRRVRSRRHDLAGGSGGGGGGGGGRGRSGGSGIRGQGRPRNSGASGWDRRHDRRRHERHRRHHHPRPPSRSNHRGDSSLRLAFWLDTLKELFWTRKKYLNNVWGFPLFL